MQVGAPRSPGFAPSPQRWGLFVLHLINIFPADLLESAGDGRQGWVGITFFAYQEQADADGGGALDPWRLSPLRALASDPDAPVFHPRPLRAPLFSDLPLPHLFKRLAVNAKSCRRASLKPQITDFNPAAIAVAVLSVFDSVKGFVDLFD